VSEAACTVCADGKYNDVEGGAAAEDCVACLTGFEITLDKTAAGHDDIDDCEEDKENISAAKSSRLTKVAVSAVFASAVLFGAWM